MNDLDIANLIAREQERQQKTINLIASENYVSSDVSEAMASVFGNKYAEGYPGTRYYGGNTISDELEILTQHRARAAFMLHESQWSVNVQALSGSPANLAVYSALLPTSKEGGAGKIMGLALDHGGHLSHGHKASLTGKLWQAVFYTVDPITKQLDYEVLRTQALAERPNIIIAGFTAYSRLVDWQAFRSIADECGAHLHVDMSHLAGLIAGGAYPSPFPYADTVMTTTHKTLRGPRGALIFSKDPAVTEKINKAVFPGMQGGPHLNTIAGIAVALQEATTPAFALYAEQVIKNAQTLADALQQKGWPVITDGTDSHLLLIDTFHGGTNDLVPSITGQQASDMLEAHDIIVNKNTIPYDTRSPRDPSGIRLGTAAVTTQGMIEQDMVTLADRIDRILRGTAL